MDNNENPTREEILEHKNRVLKQIDNLKKETASRRINKATGNKLREELEKELKQIDADLVENLKTEIEELKEEADKIEEEINELPHDITALTSEKVTKLKLQGELEARFRIKQVTKKEYKSQRNELADRIIEIDEDVDYYRGEIKKLKFELISIRREIKNKQEELNRQQQNQRSESDKNSST